MDASLRLPYPLPDACTLLDSALTCGHSCLVEASLTHHHSNSVRPGLVSGLGRIVAAESSSNHFVVQSTNKTSQQRPRKTKSTVLPKHHHPLLVTGNYGCVGTNLSSADWYRNDASNTTVHYLRHHAGWAAACQPSVHGKLFTGAEICLPRIRRCGISREHRPGSTICFHQHPEPQPKHAEHAMAAVRCLSDTFVTGRSGHSDARHERELSTAPSEQPHGSEHGWPTSLVWHRPERLAR